MKKILLPFFSISVFFLLLLSPVLYYSFDVHFYTQNVVQNDSTLSGQSMKYVQNVYAFIQGKSSLDPVFTSAEKSHMQDVRQIFHVVSLIEIVASILFLFTLIVFILQRKIALIIIGFFWSSLSALIFFLLVLLALHADFPTTFTIFHTIFFPQGNRAFDSSSTLIRLFPLSFFDAIALRIFWTSASLAVLVLFLDFLERKYRRKKGMVC